MTRPALTVTATCRLCGGLLDEVNPGRTDRTRTAWVGACVCCGAEWAVVAEMAQVGPPRRRKAAA